MSLTCPHCHNPVDAAAAAAEEIVCASCGASFRPDGSTTTAWTPSERQRTLGRFELINLVGAGAFGNVYRARDTELGRTVAVKVPRAGQLGSSGGSDRFLREARSVAQLRHPSIVPVFEVGQDGGLPYLVSEFVHGITLADLLTGEGLPPRAAAELAAQTADALHYAHAHGVVHRDVKPSNIMLEARGTQEPPAETPACRYVPRLMDFGLAKRDTGEVTMTVEGQVLGTPAYMSPEQARGDSHSVDGRSDVYSLGVVLYQMLTGKLPFKGNARMLLHHVLHDEPKPPRQRDPRVPKDLETVCLKAMAKEPARRYPTAGELATDLRRFLKDEPILARPVGRLEKLWRMSRRNPAMFGLTATVILLLGALAGITVWSVRSDRDTPASSPRASNSEPDTPTDDLLKVVAELDRTDPDWRLERIEAKRKVIPDDKNSAAHVRMVRRLFDVQFLRGPNKDRYRDLVMRRGLLGKLGELYPELTEAEIQEIFQGRAEGARSISSIDNSLKDLTPWTPLSPERAATLRMALENAGPALAEARLVANFPQGRHAVAWTRSMIDTVLPHIDDLRLMAKLLEADAVLQSHDGRMGQAVIAWRALVNTGRSIGDEPLAISQIVRMGTVERGVACLEWMLAEGSLSESNLSVVQEMLQEEVRHPTFEIMIRGERGGVHCLFTALQAGDVDLSKVAKDWGHKEQLQIPVGTATRPAHAWILRHLSHLLEIARLPLHEQTQPVAQWEEAVRNAPEAAPKWLEWLAGLGYNVSALGRRCQFNQARLRCAVAASAVERYRLAHGDWPRDLASLVPAFLKEVPEDPYDGRPLRYRRLADGVVVYSPGPDGTDNQGNLDRSAKPPEGTDIGFRLWDVARRRQPARDHGPPIQPP